MPIPTGQLCPVSCSMPFDQVHNDPDTTIVIMARGLFAEADDFLPFVGEGDRFDFGATPVDSNKHRDEFFLRG